MEEENKLGERKSFSIVIKDAFSELGETFVAFFNAPKALWGINIPYILEGLVYFGILTILGKYSSENIALADSQSSLIYSAVTGGITFSMLLLGGFSDKIGIRKSLAIAFFSMLVGRILVALSGTLPLANGLWSPMFFTMIAGLLLMVTAYGLYQPAAYAGVKRYTTPKTAAMGYAVIYGFMNLGAFLSGFISSFTRQSFEDTFPPNGLTAVFWIYVGITLIALLSSLFLLTKKNDEAAVKRIKEETEELSNGKTEGDEETIVQPRVNNLPIIFLGVLAGIFFFLSELIGIQEQFIFIYELGFMKLDLFLMLSALTVVAIIYEFLRRRPLHPMRNSHFTFFIFILIPVQTLFAHNWLTLPYYLDRAFAGTYISEYFEVFSNLNPLLIFFLAPIVAGLTPRANVYNMMIYGTFVMAVPTFLLAFGTNQYLLFTYILFMTIGEAMWQPRFLQWISEIAPKGMTGLYMGIGQFPWFLTKVITGFYSGWFLMQYCPIDTLPSDMNTEVMWLIYALIAMVTPITLVLVKGWMTKGFKTKHAE